MVLSIKGSGLKKQALGKIGGRKASLKATNELAGLAAKALKNDLLPQLVVEERAIESLKVAAKRVRKHKPSLVKVLAKGMTAHGIVSPILVRGDEILDGNARFEAAKSLGLPIIPVINLAHLTVKQCELVKLAINRTAELGEWDLATLRDVIIDLDLEHEDLSVTGFTMPELDIIKLDGEPEPQSALNQVPEPSSTVTSKLGDLWRLGDHLLLCGSATEAASYEALLGEEKVGMVLTDPPYNVKIAGNVSGLGKKKHGEFVEATGEMSDDEFVGWLTSFCMTVRPRIAHAAIAMMFMDWRHISQLVEAGTSAGFELINMIVWDKQRGGMGGVYRSAHEFIAVFCNGATTPAVNNIKLGTNGRDRTNVWSYPGATMPGSTAAKMLAHHPTPKPVELLVDAMLDVTHAGDLVLDPFMGSGSTIVAGEECGRYVRGIELDPKYVDCAVRRWEALLGKRAVLVATGQTFAEVEVERATANNAAHSSEPAAA